MMLTTANKLPTEPIFLDAHYINTAMLHRANQHLRLAAAKTDANRMRINRDIMRLTQLIEYRIAAWEQAYGTDTVWSQYLDVD